MERGDRLPLAGGPRFVADPSGDAFLLDRGASGEVVVGRLVLETRHDVGSTLSGWASVESRVLSVAVGEAPARGEVLPLFVYGSLRRGRGAFDLLRPWIASELGEGVALGALLDLGAYPGWVPSGEETSGEETTWGELVTLKDPAAAFAALDAYEDFLGYDRAAGSLYVRVVVRVRTGRKRVPAWVYAWNGDLSHPRVPGGVWQR